MNLLSYLLTTRRTRRRERQRHRDIETHRERERSNVDAWPARRDTFTYRHETSLHQLIAQRATLGCTISTNFKGKAFMDVCVASCPSETALNRTGITAEQWRNSNVASIQVRACVSELLSSLVVDLRPAHTADRRRGTNKERIFLPTLRSQTSFREYQCILFFVSTGMRTHQHMRG